MACSARARDLDLTSELQCEVLQEERNLSCAVKEQGETSVLHGSIIQEEGGAACFPCLDGAHLRLAQPTLPLGLLRSFAYIGCASPTRGPNSI